MKPVVIGIVTAILATTMLASGAQKAQDAERQLKAAMNTELVDGNLKAAIEQYKKVVQSGNRVLAAQALVHMAECYQKLGDAESRKIYEQVLRDYADQKEAVATARARLGNNATVSYAGIVTRQVWTRPNVDIYGSVSPDGRYLSFVDGGDLALRDLAKGTEHRLIKRVGPREGAGFSSAISPDGKQVAYTWLVQTHSDLRVIDLNGSGPATPRILYDNEDVTAMAAHDWSPDGKWIAVQLRRKDLTAQIGLVSVTDRSLRVLKSVDWRVSNKVFFSPDGDYLAFDLPSSENPEQRDVFVLAADGSREIPAVVHAANDVVMGWAPDGKHLLFASDRTGAMGVWALPFREGKPQGAPELVKSDIGLPWTLGITRSGALYFGVRTGGSSSDLYVASVDFSSGQVSTAPVHPIQQFVGFNSQPDWSPDGKYLAYMANDYKNLAVLSVETGQTRELRPNVQFTQWNWPRWAPDGRSIMVQGRDGKGRQGAYRIDAQTGQVSSLMQSAPGEVAYTPQWAPDGKRIFYRGTDSARKEEMIIERDLGSGKEREVLRRKALLGLSAAPDGRYLAVTTFDQAAKESILLVVPVEGGEPRELLRLREPEAVYGNSKAWTPDSRSVLFVKRLSATGENRNEYWLAPVSGGQPRKIDLDVPLAGNFDVHPDGSHVAFTAGGNRAEVWVMENFLPTLSAKR